MVSAAACLIGAINHPSILAQVPAPGAQTAFRFEVASIRPHKNTPPVDSARLNLLVAVAQASHNGIFILRGVPLTVLIRLAYNVKDFQVIGLPGWASVEGYEISAKASSPVPFEQMRPMLQALLAE
jgi:uncharacterized protein (TIGR03435 family)